MKRKIFLVIPAYNEGPIVGEVVRNLFKTFKSDNQYTYNFIVVDDGSKDDTVRQAQKAGAHVIPHILNTGSGGATSTGLSFAKQNNAYIAATLDADGQHNPKDVLRGIDLMKTGSFDLLIGSRLINFGGMSRIKRLGNRGLSFITYMLFGVNVTDSQSGLRIFSEKALHQLHWKTSGYEFCSEMLWRAKQQKLKIGEYPIEAIYTEYSKTKGQNNWNAFNIIKSLLRHRIVELLSE